MQCLGGGRKLRHSKPERLIQRIFHIATSGDLVLDSFLGSGTTAAVAQRWGGAGSASKWASTPKRITCRVWKKWLPASRAAFRRRRAGRGRLPVLPGWNSRCFLADAAHQSGNPLCHAGAWVWYRETRTPWVPGAGRERRSSASMRVAYPALQRHPRRPPAKGGKCADRAAAGPMDERFPPCDPRVIFGESCPLKSPARLKAARHRVRCRFLNIRAR